MKVSQWGRHAFDLYKRLDFLVQANSNVSEFSAHEILGREFVVFVKTQSFNEKVSYKCASIGFYRIPLRQAF